MSKHLLAFILSVIAVLFASLTRAQTNSVNVNSATSEIKKESALSLSLDASTSSDLEEEASSTSTRSSALDATLSYKFSENFKLGINQSVTQKTTGLQETTFSNTALIATFKKFAVNNDLSLIPSARVFLPTNKSDREDASLQGAASARLTAIQKLNAISLTGYIDGLVNSHKFETKADRSANLSNRLRLLVSAELAVTDKISVSGTAFYQAGRTYEDALRTAFSLSQDISYSFTEKTSVYFSHTNDGSALEANGTDSSIDIADNRESVLTLGLITKF